jgi:hypothetical protein
MSRRHLVVRTLHLRLLQLLLLLLRCRLGLHLLLHLLCNSGLGSCLLLHGVCHDLQPLIGLSLGGQIRRRGLCNLLQDCFHDFLKDDDDDGFDDDDDDQQGLYVRIDDLGKTKNQNTPS